jgi:hypothetical protein
MQADDQKLGEGCAGWHDANQRQEQAEDRQGVRHKARIVGPFPRGLATLCRFSSIR